jgi:glycosyltransferase involved in cell wall biosynthesis
MSRGQASSLPTRRVARIITRLNIGGPSIQAIDLSRELAAHGFSTCLIHGQRAASEGDMTAILPIRDAEVEYVPDLMRPVSPIHDARALWRLYRTLCRWRPEIVHTHMAKAGALGRLAALAYNRTAGAKCPARIVHTYHGHVFEGYFNQRSTRTFLGVERRLGRVSDALVAISPAIRRDIIETYGIARPERVRLIPLGFNLDRFIAIDAAARERAKTALQIPTQKTVVATVGRLTAIKRQSLFLEMARQLAPFADRLMFLIVGDGELRADLEQQATALGLQSIVRFLGWRGDLETVYGASDIFALTSANEGTPVALIEAMAAGVASVSTDVGGVRDVITGTGVGALVPSGDAAAMAREVERYVNAPDRRKDVGLAARAAVTGRFSLRRLVRDISDLYSDLLGFEDSVRIEACR